MKLGLWEIKRHGPANPDGIRELQDVLEGLDIIEVNRDDGYILAAPQQQLEHPLVIPTGDRPKLRELGSSGGRWRKIIGGDEYNAELAGINGYITYDRMRRSDATVAELLKVYKTPIVAADWFVDTADPESEEANMQAEFVQNNLFRWMSTGWIQLLGEILTQYDFGYSYFEKVFTFHKWKGERRVIWKKLATRSVFDAVEWIYDKNGGPQQVRATDFEGGMDVFMDIQDLLVFTYRKEQGNIEGRSALREVFKHWYYKENLYKIDAIQKERHGIGIPVIKLPPNFTPNDKALADELGRNLRTNEWAHIVLPPFWEVEFAEVRGQTVDILQSIDHHDTKILDSGLAGFVASTPGATSTEELNSLFQASLRHVADLICEVFNLYAIPELISHNWKDVEEFPELKARHIGQVADLRTISFNIRNLVGAKVIIPDDNLEDYMRELNHLPRRDPDTAREAETPQMPEGEEEDIEGAPNAPKPPRVGPPRQGPPSPKPQRGNAGIDQSGGK